MPQLPELPERVAHWEPQTLGYHRAVIAVEAHGPAVRARIPWRRRDPAPEACGLILTSARGGERVGNLLRVAIGRECGEIVFEPIAGAGEYHLYWLPFAGTIDSYYPRTEPLPLEEPADPAWLASLPPCASLPEARVVALEACGDEFAFTEMERIATGEEVAELLARHPGAAMLLFPEDRDHPIRMEGDLPARWARQGPAGELRLEAARGEYRVFQLGVWAPRGALGALSLRASGPVIEEVRCTNLGGTAWDGQPMRKSVAVAEGRIQALWCGLAAPEAPGTWRGSVTVESACGASASLELTLVVTDESLPAQGDDEPWRLSRLRWLDSQLGAEDEVVPPYTPVEREGDRLRVLGREVVLGPMGLPGELLSLIARDGRRPAEEPRAVLSRPMAFLCEAEDGSPLPWQPSGPLRYAQGESFVAWSASATAEALQLECRGRLEMDGALTCEMSLRAERDTVLGDARLELALPAEVARYMTGLGWNRGLRPRSHEWRWDVARSQDSVWLGDVGAGLQLSLRDDSYARPLNTNFYHLRPLVLPRSWANEGRGGIRVETLEDGTCLLRCSGGPRALEAGEELRFDFRLLLTPFRPLEPAGHLRERYWHAYTPVAEALEAGANTINIHHANEINPWINYPFLRSEALRSYIDEAHEAGCAVKAYYTVRELSTRAPELFALMSLGDEVIVDGPGGGHPWLREHLEPHYIAAWHAKEIGDVAVINGVLSRWHNFWVEGLDWLARNTAIDGLYLDDVGFGREVLQRARRVLARRRPRPRIDLHSANQFNERDGFAGSASLYLELMPYVDRLWFGEYFDYDESPEYWLVEVSGIPFGLMGEMLEGGGNPWRGMVFAMTGRAPGVRNTPLWRAIDNLGLPERQMLGWWTEECPVRTGCDDVRATAWVGEDDLVAALASWSPEPVEVTLAVEGAVASEWELHAPEIEGFQPALRQPLGAPLPLEPGRGWLVRVRRAAP